MSKNKKLSMNKQVNLAQHKYILDNMPTGVYLTDRDGKCLYVNHNWQKMAGLSLDQAKGDGWIDGIFSDDREFVVQEWQKFTNKKEAFECTYRFKNVKNESIYWVFGRAVPTYDESGKIDGYLGTVLDVTSERLMIEEIEKQRLQLIHSSRLAAMGEMAGGIAHEINNPLAIIQGYAQRILKLGQREVLDFDKTNQLAEKIVSTCERISLVIKGLLSFSRTDSNSGKDLHSVDSIVKDCLGLCQERMKQSLINFSYEIDDPEMVVLTRPMQLAQVLINLINNATQAIVQTDHPWIKLIVYKQDKNVVFDVIDSGRINPKIANAIFDPFFTTKESSQGTGLGLSISKKIINEHNGSLILLKESKNTTFRVTVPLFESDFECFVA